MVSLLYLRKQSSSMSLKSLTKMVIPLDLALSLQAMLFTKTHSLVMKVILLFLMQLNFQKDFHTYGVIPAITVGKLLHT